MEVVWRRTEVKLFTGTIVFLVLLACVAPSSADPHCTCPVTHQPVCGSDGKTYPNQCLLNCHKTITRNDIEILKEGFCEDISECICLKHLEPVCGTDGVNYTNLCHLKCARLRKPTLEVYQQGKCIRRVKRMRRSKVFLRFG